MGADAVVVFFGIKFVVANDGELERLETRQDERLITSRKFTLQTWFGRVTDGQPYQLMIGHRLAVVGVENQEGATFSREEVVQIMADTMHKLARAGFDQSQAALHCVLAAEY